MYQVRRNSQTSSEIKESASFQAAAIEIDNFLSEGNTRRADSRVRQLLMEILRTYREETGQRYIEEMKNRWGFLFDIEQFVRSSRYLLQREREERQRLVEGERLLRNFAFPPVAVEQPTGVAARVFNTYKILLSGRETDRGRGVSDADPRPFVTGNCRTQGGAISRTRRTGTPGPDRGDFDAGGVPLPKCEDWNPDPVDL